MELKVGIIEAYLFTYYCYVKRPDPRKINSHNFDQDVQVCGQHGGVMDGMNNSFFNFFRLFWNFSKTWLSFDCSSLEHPFIFFLHSHSPSLQ